MLTVIIGLTLHFFVLMTILLVVSRRGRQFIATMSKALITAFGTASSICYPAPDDGMRTGSQRG